MLVSPKDYEQIAEKIIFLLNNKKTRDNMGIRARKKVVEQFSIGRMIKEHEELYAL